MKILLALTAFLSLGLALHAEENPEAIRNVTADEAQKIIASDQQLLVLDIRTPVEFADGRITGATNLDFYEPDFADELAKLDREKSYLLHCRSGGRSSKALAKMRELGFKHIYHLDAGFNGWLAAGLPVEK